MLLFAALRRFFKNGQHGWTAQPSAPSQIPAKPPAAPPIKPRATQAPSGPGVWRRLLTSLAITSKFSELLNRRQSAYMRRMLKMFEDGDIAEALRHALPLGGEQGDLGQAFGTPTRRDDLDLGKRSGPGTAISWARTSKRTCARSIASTSRSSTARGASMKRCSSSPSCSRRGRRRWTTWNATSASARPPSWHWPGTCRPTASCACTAWPAIGARPCRWHAVTTPSPMRWKCSGRNGPRSHNACARIGPICWWPVANGWTRWTRSGRCRTSRNRPPNGCCVPRTPVAGWAPRPW